MAFSHVTGIICRAFRFPHTALCPARGLEAAAKYSEPIVMPLFPCGPPIPPEKKINVLIYQYVAIPMN
jgi:hypothetical protein